MKKMTVASAVLASLLASGVNAATVYQNDETTLSVGGRAEARFNISDENKTTENDSFKDKSRARVNLKGKTQLAEGFGAFGTYELEVESGKDQQIDTRYLFAGIGTQFGAFSYGQQDSAQVILTDFTDILATFGGDAADLVDGNKDKRENNFLYAGSFDALTITANYIANDKRDSDNYGLSAVYSFPFGLDVGAGYVDGKEGDVDADQYNLTAAYTFNDFYIAGLYADGSKGDADLKAYEIAAAYKFNKLTIQGVYNFQEEKANGISTDTVDYFALEGVYKFNGNFRAYAGYLFEQIDGQDDQLQAGLRYDF
ncbi:porin [Photobacterium ganghwense]|uniref:porin n=1 Tax=Photobacterium ganghwense TaxID=320778 RepID=UPI001C2D7FC4|nr:porin [Photobacterium ganghwense]MBV1842924.1 porin [Photobacterium ganghwense]